MDLKRLVDCIVIVNKGTNFSEKINPSCCIFVKDFDDRILVYLK